MSHLQMYSEYKESGVAWLGEIPKHWGAPRLRYLARITTGGRNTEDKKPDGDFNFYVRSQKVERIDSYSFEGEGILTAGDGVGVGKVFHHVNEKLDFHQRVYLFYKFPEYVSARFLFYYLRIFLIIDLKLYNAKSTVDSIRLPTLKNFQVCLPPILEQTAIARFLDYKVGKIDRFIRKKKQLIKLLNEQKAAIVNEAVTKGLDPTVPMKDSGIAWLGEIPAHWEVRKLKTMSKTTSGATPLSSNQAEYYDGEIPWVRTTDLTDDFVTIDDIPIRITNKAVAETACSRLPIGSVLVGMYGGAGTIGKNGLLMTAAVTNQAVCGIFPSSIFVSRYLQFYLHFYRPFWMITASGTRKDPNIGQEHIRNLLVAMPPRSEQEQIVDFIESETAIIKMTITTIQKEIALTEEYRTALIAEAVTGKIDVRGYAMRDEGLEAYEGLGARGLGLETVDEEGEDLLEEPEDAGAYGNGENE